MHVPRQGKRLQRQQRGRAVVTHAQYCAPRTTPFHVPGPKIEGMVLIVADVNDPDALGLFGPALGHGPAASQIGQQRVGPQRSGSHGPARGDGEARPARDPPTTNAHGVLYHTEVNTILPCDDCAKSIKPQLIPRRQTPTPQSRSSPPRHHGRPRCPSGRSSAVPAVSADQTLGQPSIFALRQKSCRWASGRHRPFCRKLLFPSPPARLSVVCSLVSRVN